MQIKDLKKKTNKGAKTARHKPQCDCPKCFDKQTEAVRCAMGLDKCK